MQNNIKSFMDDWAFYDQMLVEQSNGNREALNDRQYRKEKLKDITEFLRDNNGKKLSSRDEKARLIILRTSKRQMERKLYPNRFIRYARRAFGAIKRAGARWTRNVTKINEPVPDFMSYPRPEEKQRSRDEQIKEVVKATVLKLPVKNKYAAVKGAKQSRGRSL